MDSKEFRLVLMVVSCLFAFRFTLSAEETDQNKQEALQAEIEHSLVAPCCWNMTVDHHDSPASRKLRTQITQFIKAGKSKEEILEYFSSPSQYGERILASPSQKTLLGKSAYWLIPIAFVFGVLVVGMTIRRLSGPTAQEPAKKSRPSESSKKGSPWDDRVEEELSNFE